MKNKCRVCFSSDVLFAWNTVLHNNITYEDVFYHCTQFERVNESKFDKICSNCEADIRNIYKFIEKAKASFQKINEANTDEDDDSDQFEIEFLENEGINYKILKAANDSETDALVLNNLEEANDLIEQELPIDEFCEEEFNFETTEEPEISDNTESEKKINPNPENTCEYCGKCLSSKITKARHIQNVHKPPCVVLCDECPSTFKSKLALAKHRKIHQSNRERKYACQYCNVKFFTSSNCRSHENTHSVEREKKYKCDYCDKAFYRIGALNIHKRMHTGQLQHCVICDKRYPRLVDLKIHMRTHTNDRPFQCDQCENTFISSSALGLHVRKVHLGFTFKCNICSKRFQAAELLKQHKTVHNTFPYVCGLCNGMFVKRFFLHRHLKRVHRKTNEADLKPFVIVLKNE